MFHNLGMLEFKYLEAPSYQRLTLEFLSTIEFEFDRKWNGTMKCFFGTLTFRLFNQDHQLIVDKLGGIL